MLHVSLSGCHAAARPTSWLPIKVSGRPCLDIAQQLQAVEKAIVQAKKTLIQDHIDHCLDDLAAPLPRQERVRIEEFKLIAKYL